jgi:hypothetical protein
MGRMITRSGLALGAIILIGFVGAWLFNPDTGVLVRNEVLWRIFGLMAEGGLGLTALLSVLVVLVGAVALLLRR